MTTTSKLDEARLRELAEAATQGEWKACGTIYEYMNCEIRSGRKGEGQAIAQVWDGPNAFRDGQHISACSPATILALLDALSAERERGDRAVKDGMCRIDMDGDTDLLDDLAISGDHIKLLRLEDMGEGFWGRVYMHDGSDIVLSIGAKRNRVSVIVERELATQKAEGA